MVEALGAKATRDFDVYDSPGRSQAYPGTSSETDKSRQAADQTRGIVISHVEQGQTKILYAFYSSTCGGSTVPAETIFDVSATAPLAGVECTWCRNTPSYRWTATISQADLLRALSPLMPQVRMEQILALSIPDEARNADGSAKAVVVTFRSQGRQESMGVKAAKLREALGTTTVKSTRIASITVTGGQAVIEGMGFGHRVGLCQFGAEEQAKAGRNAGQILQHYYPTSKLIRVY